MKTCARCGQTYPPDVTFCSRCGLLLPGWRGLGGSGPDNSQVSHIDFLLQQLQEWVEQEWVRPEQARQIHDEYQERRWRLLNPAPPPVYALPEAGKGEKGAEKSPTGPPPPPVRRVSPLAAFFEEQNLSLWQLAGALLLLAGLVGLVRWTWGSVGKYLVLALMLGLTGGLAALARSRFVREQRLTRSALVAIAALLVPLDIVAVNAFRLLGGALNAHGIGLLTGVFCLPLYVRLMRREPGRWPIVLAAGDAAVTVYFLVHWLSQTLLPTASHEVRGAFYGLAYAGLAVPFLIAARRADEERRAVWLQSAHAATLAALAFAVWLGGVGTVGALAATLLLIGFAYGLAAALLNDRTFAHLALAAVTLGGALALHRLNPGGWADHWYGYVVWGQAMGLVSWAAGRRLERQQREVLAAAARDGGLALGGLAVFAQAAGLVFAFSSFPGIGLPVAELWGRLTCTALSLGFFALVGLETVAAGLFAYSFVLLGLLTSRYTPPHVLWHDQPNLGLPLALAAFLLRVRRQERTSLTVGALGLLTCGVYAGINVFGATTLLTLPLLIVLFAAQAKAIAPQIVYAAAAAAVLEVLVGERSALPWAQSQWGWEPNYGLGLFVLVLLGLALAEWLRRRGADDPHAPALHYAALGVAGLGALWQIVYALSPAYPYSPLLLLGAGALFAGLAGGVRQLPRTGDWTAALTAALYLAFALGQFTASPPGAALMRETLAAALLLPLALLLAFLAVRQDRPILVYAAALAGTAAIVHGLHRALHPVPAVYALALWPPVAGLQALAIRFRAQHPWQAALEAGALLIALPALSTATALTLLNRSQTAELSLLPALAAYGALYAVVGLLTRRGQYAGLFALCFSGAGLLRLCWNEPPLSASVLAFLFSFTGLFWLAAALALERLAPTRFAARALRQTALVVGIITLVLALLGLGGNDARYAVYALLLAGSVFLGAAWGLEAPIWGHLGVVTYFLAYFLYLAKRLGTPGLASSDFYLIPAGLYILALGLLARRRTRSSTPSYFLTGLLLVLTPTLVAAWQPAATPVHALLLLTECVAALFYGIAARIKVFVGAGTGFLIALLERETQGMVSHVHWAVYATGLGLAILTSALFLEKRRDEVRRWAQAAQEKLKEWD